MTGGAAHQASEKFNTAARTGGWPALCDASLAFSEPRFAPLIAIWEMAAAAGRLPRRADFNPRALKSLIRNVAIYERVAGRDVRYRVRLMGTAYTDVMGDLSGKFIDETVSREFLPRWSAAFEAALEAGAPLRFLSRSDTGGKTYLVAEYFEAPLLADDGSPNMILAAGHFAPRRWADVAEHERERIAAAVP
ncbi:MAG TPA: PAS domain-containing protein [Rhizomicrobium sp.]|nr:PAS domain-containing protein [Rhizomicrobium sp.]